MLGGERCTGCAGGEVLSAHSTRRRWRSASRVRCSRRNGSPISSSARPATRGRRLAGVGRARARATHIWPAACCAVEPPGRRGRARLGRPAHRGRDRHGVGKVARLPAADAVGDLASVDKPGRARRHRAVPVADQGAGAGPARLDARARRAGRPPDDLRRRLHPRGARLGAQPRQLPAHQPRHAASDDAAVARALVARSGARSATSWSTSATTTGVSSVRTSRRSCAGCGGWRRTTARPRRS